MDQHGVEVVIAYDFDLLVTFSWGKPRGSSIFLCSLDQLSHGKSLKPSLILGYLSWGKPRGSSVFLAFQPLFWHLWALRLFFFRLTWLLGSSKVLYNLKNPVGLQQLRLLYMGLSHSIVRSTWQYPKSWGSSTSSPSLNPNGNPQFRWSKLK